MAERRPSSAAGEAEAWFVRHGLPYFVDDTRALVAHRLSRARVLGVVAAALVLGVLAGVLLATVTDPSYGVPGGASVAGAVLLGYALRSLRASVIARWALRRGFGSLGLLLPLATRALPMLLLFITFLFINTEVWQVASALQGGVLWGAVLFFAAAALLFLVPRLADELDTFDDAVSADDVLGATASTPFAAVAREVVDSEVDLPAEAQVTGLQMVNLVVVLAVAQAVQVVLLSVAVFAFFMVFGAVAIDDAVIDSWLGHGPSPLLGQTVVSVELLHVSVFLAGFSGLYFTVVAITDELYRKEFFGEVLGELARAVGVRVVYRELRRRQPEGGAPALGLCLTRLGRDEVPEGDQPVVGVEELRARGEGDQPCSARHRTHAPVGVLGLGREHPAGGERDAQVVAPGVEHVGVDRLARLHDDLVAGEEVGQVAQRLAVGHPVPGEREVALLPGRRAAGEVAEARGQRVVVDALEQRDGVVVTEGGHPHDGVGGCAVGRHRSGPTRLPPLLAQVGDRALVAPLRDEVGAVELPADVAEEHEPGRDQCDPAAEAPAVASPCRSRRGCRPRCGAGGCARAGRVLGVGHGTTISREAVARRSRGGRVAVSPRRGRAPPGRRWRPRRPRRRRRPR